MFADNGPTLLELIQQGLSSTRRGYDLLAPKFDATPFRTPDSVLEPAIAVIGPVDAALDVCCGTGAAMQFLRPLCRERLVGLDFSLGMIAQARHNLATTPGDVTPEFVEADALTMDFDQEFDAVTCFGALGHILPNDQSVFLRGIYDALKPGGRFVFVSAPRPHLLAPVSLILCAFNLIMKIRNALLKPPFIMYYLTFLLPDVLKTLNQAGFQVEVRPGRFPAPFQRYCIVIATR